MNSLIQKHFEVQEGMYFSKTFTIGNWIFFVSDIIEDGFWNYALLPKDASLAESLHSIESVFKRLNRPSSIYVINSENRISDISTLISNGYEKMSEESFMTFSRAPSITELLNDVQIKRAVGGEEMHDFISVFTNAYGGDKTPEQPYGELAETYVQALIRSFGNSEKFFHYVCYYNNFPVAVASLCLSDRVGGIYNVGTDPIHRGRGFGTMVTNACINQWQLMNGTTLLLQTETGSAVEKWYNDLGFKVEFRGTIYSKTI